jgi:FKBP-type peptidyl-prolyl cis-trans isomerase
MIYSCSDRPKQQFKEVAQGVSYKYLKFGEGDSIQQGDYLMCYITVLDEKADTLHYVPRYAYFLEVKDQLIDSVWLRLGEGDSVHIKCDRKILNDYLRLYGPLQSDSGTVIIRASLQASMDEEELQKTKKAELSKRELDEQLELQNYLKHSKENFEYINGIYRKILERTDGDSIGYGDQLRVAYKGYFLDGYVFDDTESKGITPTFRYGEDFQLLEGVQSGLMGLKEGESVKIILPSRRAFGEEGSLAGIVPPYTSVIFEIKILKIEK